MSDHNSFSAAFARLRYDPLARGFVASSPSISATISPISQSRSATPAAIAKHLGHDSLSGPALGKIGALRAYGLIDGTGDELRITDEAVTALMAPDGSADRVEALRTLAMRPALFREISNDFEGLPSEDNLRYWLAKRGYTQEAITKAAKAYLGTMALVPQSAEAYDSGQPELEEPMPAEEAAALAASAHKLGTHLMARQVVPVGVRQAVFPLSEGDVTITFPADMSAEAFEELGDYLEIFLRKAQRDAIASPVASEKEN